MLQPLHDCIHGTVIRDAPIKEAGGGLIIPLQDKKIPYIMHVEAVGPDCKYVKPGDYVILPQYGGTVIRVVDDETNELNIIFLIREDAVLARWLGEV